MVIDLEPRLGVTPEDIAAFCRRWGVEELSLFGSVLRDDFRPDSDVDVLVRFAPGLRPRGFGYVDMQLELEALFRRPVDLIEQGRIENPFRRASIMQSRAVMYAA